MRLTAILLTVCSLTVAARTSSQTITFSGNHVSLETVFSVIKQQTGFLVIYTTPDIASSRSVSIEANALPLKDFLSRVFQDQPLVYSLVNTTIVVKLKAIDKPSPSSSVFFIPPITGIVTDEDGNPLSGINISIKGTTIGIVTDANGKFNLNADPGATLVISSVEYETQQYKVGASQKAFAIQLSKKVVSMHEVVVNKGYYRVKDELNTGNVFTVKGEELRKQPVTDPMLALEGRVPGLMISQTAGVPGAPLKIQLRGKNFISGGLNFAANDPLYIVDGMPFSSQSFLGYNSATVIPDATGAVGLSPFNILNPADIESIDILKGADASAIYGSRGANGVILITTRKGKAGKTKVDVNFMQGYSRQATTTQLLNTQQYLEMNREAYKNDGLVLPSIATNPNDRNFSINGFWDTSRYTNWAKELMGKTAVYTNAQAGISGGNAGTQFLINGGYSRQGNYFPGNYVDQRASLHFDLGHSSVDQRFHIDLSGTYMNDNNNVPPVQFQSSIVSLPPDAPALYDAKGNLNWQPYKGSATWSNPLAYVYQTQRTITNNLAGILTLSYQIFKGLVLTTRFNYQTTQSTQQSITPSNVSAPPRNALPISRNFAYSTTSSQTFNNENQLNYHLKIGRSNLDALVGSTIQDSKGNSLAYTANGYSSDALITNVRSASTFYLGYTNSPEYRFNSLYARVGCNWEQKYIVNFTARRDGSSRFGPGRQFGDFGSGGIGWIFSKESFIQQSLRWLSFGKLSTNYGVTGSDGIVDYAFLSTYSSDPFGGTYFGVTALGPTGITDPYFRWQQNKQLEGRIQLGFLQDRINTDIVYYRNRSDNQLVRHTLAYSTGFNGVITNFPALVQNTGWELTLNTVNIQRKNLSWTTFVNVSIPKNKLVAYPGLAISGDKTRFAVGQSVFSKLVYHYTGVDPQTGLYTAASNNQVNFYNAYPQDLIWSKPITQKYFGGMSNTLSYKDFSLDLFIQFVKQLGYGYQRVFGTQPGFGPQPAIVMNRWQKPGDKASVQKFTTGLADYLPAAAYQGILLASDGVITDASFIRFKNVQLAYRLPRSWQQRVHLQNARIYLQGQNLFTLTKYQVLDPETQNLFAPVKTITAGIQVTL